MSPQISFGKDAHETLPIPSALPEPEAATGAVPKSTKPFSAFQHRNYQLWFSGQLVSVIGTWMQNIARSWLLYELSRSEFILGLMGFVAALPVLLITPWGGVLTDTLPKRRLLIFTQSIAMSLAFILALLTFRGTVQIWHILLLAALNGATNALDAPARQAFVVEMVGREDMQNAITLNSMLMNGARIVGPAIGGVLLAWVGSAWCFLLNGVSFLAVIGGLLGMQVQPQAVKVRLEKPLAQFVAGLHYARSQRVIGGLLAISVIFGVFGLAYAAILPAFVDKVLAMSAAGFAWVNAMIGVGAVLAALAMAVWGNKRRRGKLLWIANLAFPLVLIIFAYNPIPAIALFLAIFLGFGFMLQINSLNVLLQLQVSDAMRGRVMSLFTLSFFGLAPFGSLLVGWVGEYLSLNLTISLSAVVMLSGVLWVHLRMPELRKL
ncbi:MAG TPA: MFS transporter [Anaerolineales bacterium]|nr:MFS transporter [Anaerolineales bacterium]